MHKVTSFFWFCSGSDPRLLEKCPSESSKYVGIGATIFFTGIFAALAGAYALHTVFDNIYASVFFGLLWGLLIFNLDRYIVSSMRKEGKPRRELLLATPRIILAVLISFVIAKPLELKIFDKEIQPELIVMEQQKFAQQEALVRARYESTQDSLQHDIDRLRGEIETQAKRRDQLVIIAQEEADGTGGSRKRNLGPIYKVKKADADRAEKELQELTRHHEPLIVGLRARMSRNDSLLNADVTSLERGKINGLAARMEALDRLTNESSAIAWAHWFIILLFIAIETSPVFVKLISSKGPYDNQLKVEEHQFQVLEIEEIAKSNTEAKGRASSFAKHESTFVSDRLDGLLKNTHN